jgi:hypothetical protein
MKRIVMVMAMAMAIVPGSALASSSTCKTYHPQTCTVLSSTAVSTTTTGATRSVSAATLPFTGLDVALLLAGGALLVGTGLVVRRFSRHLD